MRRKTEVKRKKRVLTLFRRPFPTRFRPSFPATISDQYLDHVFYHYLPLFTDGTKSHKDDVHKADLRLFGQT